MTRTQGNKRLCPGLSHLVRACPGFCPATGQCPHPCVFHPAAPGLWANLLNGSFLSRLCLVCSEFLVLPLWLGLSLGDIALENSSPGPICCKECNHDQITGSTEIAEPVSASTRWPESCCLATSGHLSVLTNHIREMHLRMGLSIQNSCMLGTLHQRKSLSTEEDLWWHFIWR